MFGGFGNHKYVCRLAFPREPVLHGGSDVIRILPDSGHTDDNGRQKRIIVNRRVHPCSYDALHRHHPDISLSFEVLRR